MQNYWRFAFRESIDLIEAIEMELDDRFDEGLNDIGTQQFEYEWINPHSSGSSGRPDWK